MQLASYIPRFKRSVAEVGLWQTLSRVAQRIYRRVVPKPVPVHPFDLQHGVDTGGLLWPKKLVSGHPHDSHITAYWGSAPSLLRGSIARWKETLHGTPCSIGEYTFIDIGAGKGRGILIASEFPFLRVLGVELNPGLVAIARQNLERWNALPHPCTDLEIFHADALELSLPDSPAVLYLFHPFDEHVMLLFLERIQVIAQRRTAPVDFIYTRPEYVRLFAATPGMQLLSQGDIPFTDADIAGDAFDTRQQTYHVYRLQRTNAAQPRNS